jgi:hypothetical protein
VTEAQNIPWKRISVEAAAIVASILLAFAIDAWWIERQDRLQESEMLGRLSAEITLNIELFKHPQYKIGWQDTVDLFDAVEAALARGDKSIDFPTLSLRRSMFMSSFEANTPIQNAMISSGRLELVENANIVSALADWEANLRNYTELVQRSRLHLDSQYIPAFFGRADIGSVLARKYSGGEIFSGVPDLSDTTNIKIDEELKGLLGARLAVTRITQGAIRWSSEAAVELLDAVNNAQTE